MGRRLANWGVREVEGQYMPHPSLSGGPWSRSIKSLSEWKPRLKEGCDGQSGPQAIPVPTSPNGSLA